MPVITVTAPALASTEDELRALGQVAVEVAAALGLTAEDVQVSCVHSAAGVLGRRAVAPWPVVVIHGTRRAHDRMADAVDRARDVVGRAWARTSDEVWVHWLVAT
jgi:hypothetical protein